MNLKPGQWFMWDTDRPMPDRLTVCEGEVRSASRVTTISRFQAMAIIRWHKYGIDYCSYRRGNGNFRDVYVVGDIEAWYGPED